MTVVSRPTVRLPEAGRCWVRYTPRHWPCPGAPEAPWTHLGEASLGPVGRRRQWAEVAPHLQALAELELDDLLYLPPVTAEVVGEAAGEAFEACRRRVAAEHLRRGTPVLYQLQPGQAMPEALTAATVVYDPLPLLLQGDLAPLADLPAGVSVIWPLIAGVSDDPDLWGRACEALAAAGVVACQPLALRLQPRQRRRLAERLEPRLEADQGEEVFSALFHRPPPSEQAFAQCATRHGLEAFLPRPLPRSPLQHPENRRLGGELALIGELWYRLGHTGSRGAAFYRAARWIDATHYDITALAREGNLAVVEPLDAASREVIQEALGAECSQLLARLKGEYLHPAPGRDTIGGGEHS